MGDIPVKRTLLLLALSFALSSFLSFAAEADILWFKNGRSMEGTVRDLPGGQIEITLSFGTLAFSRDKVARVEKAVSVSEIVDQALATLRPGEVEKLFELAEWCREKREHTLAQRLYRQVLAHDPDHDGARLQLGYERQDGAWMTPQEARIARGEVPFRGTWVRADARDGYLAQERAVLREKRLRDLEEARLALELSRFELETERLQGRPPANGLPIYGYSPLSAPLHGSPLGFHHSGFFIPEGFDPSPNRQRPVADRETNERRHTGTIPRHRQGGFVAPRRH